VDREMSIFTAVKIQRSAVLIAVSIGNRPTFKKCSLYMFVMWVTKGAEYDNKRKWKIRSSLLK